MISNRFIFSLCCFSVLYSASCAFDIVHVKQVPTQLESLQPKKKSWRLIDDVEVRLSTGFKRRLKSGTRWHYVGKIEYGDVFKTTDQIVTVEGSNIFEAYIVVAGDKLVGFYLPVEQTYSPLSSPRELQIETIDLNN